MRGQSHEFFEQVLPGGPGTSGALGGATTAGLAGLAWRYASIESPRAEIKSMLMLTPAVSLGWIALTSGVEVREPMWLVLGLIGVIMMSALSQIRSKWAHPGSKLNTRRDAQMPRTKPDWARRGWPGSLLAEQASQIEQEL